MSCHIKYTSTYSSVQNARRMIISGRKSQEDNNSNIMLNHTISMNTVSCKRWGMVWMMQNDELINYKWTEAMEIRDSTDSNLHRATWPGEEQKNRLVRHTARALPKSRPTLWLDESILPQRKTSERKMPEPSWADRAGSEVIESLRIKSHAS